MTGRLRSLGPYVLFTALVVAVYADPLFFSRVFTGRDLIAYNIPMEKSVHDAWASGELPVWTPEISGGRPLAPNPNMGAFYPPRILFAHLPFGTALRVGPVLHWAAAGIGMLLLLSAFGVSPGGAWIGAVTYVFSGVSVSEIFYPHIQPGMTLLPWIVWQARRARGLRGVMGLSVAFALILLAADVFTIAVALACAALFLVLEQDEAEAARGLGRVAAAVVLAAMAAAPQILATALWIPQTNRGVLGMKLSNATLYSISPWRLMEFVVPYPFGPTWRLDAWELWGGPVHHYRGMGLFGTLYLGALPVIAAAALWRARHPGLRFARVLLVLALAVSVLPTFLPESWGAWQSPLPLRNPEKFAVAIVLAFSIFGAWGFDVLRERAPGRVALAVAIVLAGAALGAAFSPDATGRLAMHWIAGDGPFPDRAGASLPFALSTGGLLWVATLVALDLLHRGGGARVAALVLLTLVPIAANRPIARTWSELATLGPTSFARRISRADPSGFYRTLGADIYRPVEPPRNSRYGGGWETARQDWVHDTPVLWKRGMVFNYDFDEGDLARVESLRKLSGFAAGFPDASSFFGAFSLRWCVRHPAQPPLPGYHRFGGNGAQDWDEHERPFPDIRLATAWIEERGAVASAARIGQIPPGGLVIETGRHAQGHAAAGTVEVRRRTQANLEIETEAADPTWLFVLRAYWDYRRVRVDGRETETFPANVAFTAIPIPAGKHRVEWEERLPGWEISRYGPVLFLVLVIGGSLASSRRRAVR
ncbi:MAG TPA: hypothetical protein VGG65_07205 [Thermoanaerobaculia bacterium]